MADIHILISSDTPDETRRIVNHLAVYFGQLAVEDCPGSTVVVKAAVCRSPIPGVSRYNLYSLACRDAAEFVETPVLPQLRTWLWSELENVLPPPIILDMRLRFRRLEAELARRRRGFHKQLDLEF